MALQVHKQDSGHGSRHTPLPSSGPSQHARPRPCRAAWTPPQDTLGRTLNAGPRRATLYQPEFWS